MADLLRLDRARALALAIALACSAACGARSALEDADASGAGGSPSQTASSTASTPSGSSTSSGIGSVGGGGPAPACDEVEMSDLVAADVTLDGPAIFGADLALSADGLGVCAVGPIQEQAPTTPYGIVCFDAFGDWPASLGDIHPLFGARPDRVAVTTGRTAGVTVLTGDAAMGSIGSLVAVDVVGGVAPSWTVIPELVAHEARFIVPAGDTALLAGFASRWTPFEHLDLFLLEQGSIAAFAPSLACADQALVADAVTSGDEVFFVSGTGRPFPACTFGDGIPPGPGTRLELGRLTWQGELELLFDVDAPGRIDAVRVVDAGDSLWVGWAVLGQVSIARVGKDGALLVSPIVVSGSAPIGLAMAMRGDELLVGHIDASDPDLGADVIVTGFALDGTPRPFAGFDTSKIPWASDLDLVVDADDYRVVVAYAGSFGTVAARRLDCVAIAY